MRKISKELKELYADKVLDLANIAAGAWVFGQFFGKDYSYLTASMGVVFLIVGYGISYWLHDR